MVVVVVVVRELLFLVASVIYVRMRGRGSEVTTTPYHNAVVVRLVASIACSSTIKSPIHYHAQSYDQARTHIQYTISSVRSTDFP